MSKRAHKHAGVRTPTRETQAAERFLPLSASDFHLLLVLTDGTLYGYAILRAIEEQAGAGVGIDIGSLYRALARLEGERLIEATEPPPDAEPAPGRTRRYYRVTDLGRDVVALETERLRAAVALADGSGATGGARR